MPLLLAVPAALVQLAVPVPSARSTVLDAIKEGFVDPETGEIVNLQKHEEMSDAFPNPWPHFRQELIARLNLDDQMQLHEQLRSFGTYAEDELPKK